MKTTFALVNKKNETIIYLWANDRETFENKIRESFRLKSGLQPKGTDYTFGDYMKDRKKVTIFFSDYEELI